HLRWAAPHVLSKSSRNILIVFAQLALSTLLPTMPALRKNARVLCRNLLRAAGIRPYLKMLAGEHGDLAPKWCLTSSLRLRSMGRASVKSVAGLIFAKPYATLCTTRRWRTMGSGRAIVWMTGLMELFEDTRLLHGRNVGTRVDQSNVEAPALSP